MVLCYTGGFVLFVIGIILLFDMLLKSGAIALLAAALLYVANVIKTIYHKPLNNGSDYQQ